MPVDLSPSFIKAFEGEVHNAYQRQGSKLRDTVRTRRGVMGSSVTFRKVGRGAAATKARHGQIPVMNVDHAAVECNLRDYYAGEWVDRLDDLKIGGGERDTVAKAGAYALGRKTDQLIAAALDGSKNFAGAATDGLTKAKVLAAFEMLGQADVPDDGERTAVIGWKQWSDLMKIEEFANADYVGAEDLPWRGTQAKRWLGTLWLPHSGLAYLYYDPKNDRDGAAKQLCKQAAAHVRKLMLPVVHVESNGLGSWMPKILQRELMREGHGATVIGTPNSRPKHERILDAFDAPLAANALWAHASVFKSPFLRELREWRPENRNGPDDGLDAAACALLLEPVRIRPVGRASRLEWRESVIPARARTDFRI